MSRPLWPLAFCGLFWVPVLVFAADEFPASPPSESIEAEIERLIDQLDERQFADRQQASQKLADLGLRAIGHVEQAAASASRETSVRAFDLLKQHLQQGEADLREAARAALNRLAESGRPAIAQRARHVLAPPPPHAVPNRNAGFANGPIRQANFQIQIGGNGPFRRQVTITNNAGGTRIVEIEENGRKTRMETLPTGRIQVEITDRQNGRSATRRLEARDIDELKRKDAEAGRLYEQYNQPARLPIGALPPPAPMPRERPAGFPAAPPATRAGLDFDMLQQAIDRYQRLMPAEPAAQEALEVLQRALRQTHATLPPPPLSR